MIQLQKVNAILIGSVCLFAAMFASSTASASTKIDREKLVNAFSPRATFLDYNSAFTLGNGAFAFTADVTGFQSFGDEYFAAGFPLETKARWAWHSRNNPGHTLNDVAQEYSAYGQTAKFPTQLNTPAADWLRQNPHDFPLPRISLRIDKRDLNRDSLSDINQQLDLLHGVLRSKYSINKEPISVKSLIHPQRDLLAFSFEASSTLKSKISFLLTFPRGYDLAVKNMPALDFGNAEQHSTQLIEQTPKSALLNATIDKAVYRIKITWNGEATFQNVAPHQFEIQPHVSSGQQKPFEFNIEFIENSAKEKSVITFNDVERITGQFWKRFWKTAAFVDLSASTDTRASELQRRIILSQYLLAIQSQGAIPTQETGLTASSWYGKHHTEMAWWHNAHWLLWNRSEYAVNMLQWYKNHLVEAKTLALTRGLQGARWPKMVGPDFRESPGGNSLIIWNQPQAIHLAEMFYNRKPSHTVLKEYADLVEQTAEALSAMLSWEPQKNRYSLQSPIWISQEIYDPTAAVNPTFELSYWRYGLETAQMWRKRLGKSINPIWQLQIEHLADLPIKNNRYVAMESIPDTFDNPESRRDHPSFLASWGLLKDSRVNPILMNNTLDAVAKTWHFDEKIWGWDYPMIAMTAARLNRPAEALDFLLADATNNRYLNNGHCPQRGVNLPAYLPANAAFLTAVAIMLEKDPHTNKPIGFPDNGQWLIQAEGF